MIFLFDFDGTLVDSMPAYCRTMLHILDENNIAYPADIMKIITPLGYVDTAKYFISELGLDLTEKEIHKKMYSCAIDEYKNNIQPKPNVITALRTLREQGASLSILTACPHVMLDPCLERLGITELFSHIWSCEDFGMNKSNPEIYRMAARRIGVPVGDILFLDDNIGAVKTAKSAGMRVCGVFDSSSAEYESEIRSTADSYICNFAELPHL